MRGLSAPTLFGDADARVVRIPALGLPASTGVVLASDLDAAVIDGELPEVLSVAVGEPVHGLLGYSFLHRYRVGLDFARGLVWFDPRPADEVRRPHEYSHVGIQLERVDGGTRVAAVVKDSPAARAAIAVGDMLEAVDGEDAASVALIALVRRLEGPPGSLLALTVRHGSTRRTVTLVRRRLL
jgi:S1-C subfamily serine protease